MLLLHHLVKLKRDKDPPPHRHNAAHDSIGMGMQRQNAPQCSNICRRTSLGDVSPITHLLSLLSSGFYNIYEP